MENPLDQLSVAQRACLRLVALNQSSKEIAKEIGLSPNTVDQYLSRAVALLGVSNRREAARRHAELEKEALNKSEYKPDELVLPSNSPIVSTQIDARGSPRAGSLFAKWLPPIGGNRHDLDAAQTVHAVVRVSFFTMGTAGAIIAIVFWLNRLML